MDVARLNFPTAPWRSTKRESKDQKVRNELNLPIPIILDTKGPR